MIGGGDGDGVDVLMFQQFAVILVRFGVQCLASLLGSRQIDVGHGDHAGIAVPGRGPEDPAPLSPHAHAGQPDLVAPGLQVDEIAPVMLAGLR